MNIKTGVTSSRIPGRIDLRMIGRLPMTVSMKTAWELYLALQSFFAAQPRNKRKGNTCPDCAVEGIYKTIDDRAERCRNHRVRKAKGDA